MPHIGTEHFVFRRVFRFVSPGRDCAMCGHVGCAAFAPRPVRWHRFIISIISYIFSFSNCQTCTECSEERPWSKNSSSYCQSGALEGVGVEHPYGEEWKKSSVQWDSAFFTSEFLISGWKCAGSCQPRPTNPHICLWFPDFKQLNNSFVKLAWPIQSISQNKHESKQRCF